MTAATAARRTRRTDRPGRGLFRVTSDAAPAVVSVAAPRPLVSVRLHWSMTAWAVPGWFAIAAYVVARIVERPPVAVLAVLLALAAASGMVGRPERRERLCATVAAVVGALVLPALAAAVLAGAAGLAWWPLSERARHRRRVRAIRAAWPAVVRLADLPVGTQLRTVEKAGRGWHLLARVPRGIEGDVLVRARGAVASALGRGEVTASVSGSDRGLVELEVIEGDDPLVGSPIPRPARPVRSVRDGAPFAVDERGQEITLPLWESSGLFGGRPRAGKSAGLSLVCAAAVEARDAALWIVDPKRGAEFDAWRPVADRFAIDEAETVQLLDDLNAEMERRYELLVGQARKIEPSREMPLLVLVVDELAQLTRDAKTRLRRLAELGSAAGVSVWAATQRPSTKLVPSELRTLFRLAVGWHLLRSRDSDVVLGEGWASVGADCSSLTEPGQCFVILDDRPPIRAKSYYLDDEAIAALVDRHAEAPGGLPEVPEVPEVVPLYLACGEGAELPEVPEVDPADSIEWAIYGRYGRSLWDHLRDRPDSAAGAARGAGCSDRTARDVLRSLADAGLVEANGNRWRAALPEVVGGAR